MTLPTLQALRPGAVAQKGGTRSAATFGRTAPTPPALIGGGKSQKTIKASTQLAAKVDWLTFTYFPGGKDVLPHFELRDLLEQVMASPVQFQTCPGMYGFDFGARLFLAVHGQDVNIGRVDFGGNQHKGRARLDLSGTGCGHVQNWNAIQHYISEAFESRITRVDLAVDLLNGEFTVDDAAEWYRAGLFNSGGRMPKHSTVGAWLADLPSDAPVGEGRTIYVGKRENGKMLRAYEKGRQLGDPSSEWVRFEVELRNKDRDIPLDILTNCDTYFVGAYTALQRVLDSAGTKVMTDQKEGEISLAKLVHHLRESYGKAIHVLRLKMTPDEVIESLSINGVPARLSKAAVNGFFESPSEQIKEYLNAHSDQRF